MGRGENSAKSHRNSPRAYPTRTWAGSGVGIVRWRTTACATVLCSLVCCTSSEPGSAACAANARGYDKAHQLPWSSGPRDKDNNAVQRNTLPRCYHQCAFYNWDDCLASPGESGAGLSTGDNATLLQRLLQNLRGHLSGAVASDGVIMFAPHCPKSTDSLSDSLTPHAPPSPSVSGRERTIAVPA